MEKFEAAVLGVGEMGATHVEAAKNSPYVSAVYGFEPDAARRAQRCRELGIQPATLEEILGNPKVRFVSIAASNSAHLPLATAALKAGKAVLCEKPMGDTLEQARQFVNLQQETRGFLQIGFELHYSKMYTQVRKWIDDGLIGTVVNNQCRYFCCEFHRKDNWRSNSTGSFLIGEKLSHYLDLQRWYFQGQRPVSIYSMSAPKVVTYFHHRDNHQIMTKYSGGGVACLNFIMYSAQSYHGDPLQDYLDIQFDDGHALNYTICGTKGVIEADVFKRRMRRFEFSDSPTGLENQIVEEHTFGFKEEKDFIHNVYGETLQVIELVAQGKAPEVTPQDAYETMRLCFAAEESENTGNIVTL